MFIFLLGKHFLRAGEMHTNIATWARLLKRVPLNSTSFSPNAAATTTTSQNNLK